MTLRAHHHRVSVLTADTCYDRVVAVSIGMHIIGGQHDGEQIQVEDQFQHLKYSGFTMKNDLLLLSPLKTASNWEVDTSTGRAQDGSWIPIVSR